MSTLRMSALTKARRGQTTFEEVLRVTASDDTGVAAVEYTVTREASAMKKSSAKKRNKFVTTRPKRARGGKSWSFDVPLSLGLNLISITAVDRLGNRSERYQVRMLRY